MYTFNRLQLLLVDEDKNPETFIKTAVGETVKFFCQSFGGRPLGEFKWYIDNNQQMLGQNYEGKLSLSEVLKIENI